MIAVGGIVLVLLGGFIATQNTQSKLPGPMATIGFVMFIVWLLQ